METENYLEYTANLANATESLDSSCETASNANLDLWYEFTMPVSGNLRITNISNLIYVAIYDACGGNEIRCFYGSNFTYNLTGGENYILRLSERTPYAGEVTFRIQAFETAPNDECANSTAITVETENYLEYTANLANATESVDSSCETASNTNLDLWYEFTMPVFGNLQVTNISNLVYVTIYDACGGNEIRCFNGSNFAYNLTGGDNYILRLSQRNSNAGEISFRVQAFETVPNDECVDRTAITVETANYLEYTANLANATESVDSSCETASNTNLDIWYEFSMPVSGNLQVTNISNLVYVAIYDACGGNEIRCFYGSNFAYNLTGGENYILRLSQRNSVAGEVTFRVQAFETAPNDECVNSTAITVETANYLEYTANLANATESVDSSCETASNTNLDLWYEFSMPVSGNLRVTNISNLVYVAIYDACEGNEIRCFYGSDFAYNLTGGENYILRLSQRNSNAGEISFRVQAFETAPNDECANALNINVPTTIAAQYEASLVSASESVDSTCDTASLTNHDLWYTFTMPINGNIEVTNINNTTGVTLYDSCNGNELSCFFDDGNFYNLSSGSSFVLRLSTTANYASDISFKIMAIETPLQPCTASTEFNAGVWNNGEPDETKNAIIRTHYDTATYGSFSACSLSIDTGAKLNVDSEDYVEVSFDINVNGILEIKHQGSIVQRDDASTTINNGNIWVRLTTPYMDAKEFMVIGSPVSGETRSDVFGNAYRVRNHLTENFIPNPDVAIDFPNAENFADDNYDNWVDYNGTLNAGEGYLVFPQANNTDSGTYNLTYNNGTLNTGDITFNVKYNTPGPTSDDNKNASPNVLANPYPSAISADDFINTNPMVDEVYFWEHITLPSTSLPGAGHMNFNMEDISMYNLMGGIAAASDPTGTETIPNGFIATAQGFGIKATEAGTAIFTNNMRRVYNNNTLRKASPTENDRVLLKVSNTANNLQSTTLIGFTENATSGIDRGYDSRRLANVISLYSHLEIGDEEFGIQSRESFDPSIKILIGFSSMLDENSEYTLSLANFDGPNLENVTAFLIDNYTNSITNLNQENYTFKAEKGTYSKRFTLQFTEKILGNESFSANEILVFPNPTKDILNIYSEKEKITQIEIYDIQGKKVSQSKFNNENLQKIDVSKFNTGLYLCKIHMEGTVIMKKIIKE